MRRLLGLMLLLGGSLLVVACGGQTIVRTVTVAKTSTAKSSSGGQGASAAGSSQAVSAASTSTSAHTPAPRMARVGDSLTLLGNESGERLQLTVDQVLDPLSVGPDDQADSGQRFVGVQITIRNVGSVVYSDSPSNGSTLLSDTNEQATDEIVTGGPCGNDFQSSVNIAPGGVQQGCIPFELPDGQSAKLFQYTLDSGFADQTGQWSLAGADTSAGQASSAAASAQPATQTTPEAPSAVASASPGVGPVNVLEAYWAMIASHQFHSAFRSFAAGAIDSSEAEWILGEKQSGIQSASFAGRVAARSGAGATVAVESLITHDHRYGCRSWSGTYAMVDAEGQWQIQRANLTPQSCN